MRRRASGVPSAHVTAVATAPGAGTAPVRVLYVGGWGRSGSTLLDRLLGQLDGTLSVGEMRDIFQRGVQENRLCGCGRPFLDCPMWTSVGVAAYGGWERVDLDHVLRLRRRVDRPWCLPALVAPWLLPPRPRAALDEYAGVLAQLYRAIDEVNGRPLVIDSSKIPTFALLLRRAGLDLRVVHLVRDSRGVVHSWRKQVRRRDAQQDAAGTPGVDVPRTPAGDAAGDAGADDLMLTYGLASACLRYDMYNVLTHVLRWVGLPYRRLRYEDLVRDPAGTLQDVSGFGGVPADPGTLAALDNRMLSMTRTHTVDGNPMRMRAGATPIRMDEGWRGELAWWQQVAAAALTFPLLRHYGYLRGRRGADRGPRVPAAGVRR